MPHGSLVDMRKGSVGSGGVVGAKTATFRCLVRILLRCALETKPMSSRFRNPISPLLPSSAKDFRWGFYSKSPHRILSFG